MSFWRFGKNIVGVMNNNIINHENKKAIATAREFAASVKWDSNEALDLAFAILTECNWHTLAAKLAEAAEAEIAEEEAVAAKFAA